MHVYFCVTRSREATTVDENGAKCEQIIEISNSSVVPPLFTRTSPELKTLVALLRSDQASAELRKLNCESLRKDTFPHAASASMVEKGHM